MANRERAEVTDPWHIGDFAASLGLSPRTIGLYRGDLERFVAWAPGGGAHSPGDVELATLRRYLAHLRDEGRAPRTMARVAASLRRYFGWAEANALVGRDPTISLRAPSGPSRLPRVLRSDELHQMLDEEPPGDDDEQPQRALRDRLVLEILYGSGLRVSELCGLTVGDVDLDGRRLTVWGKGSKQRVVPLSEPALDAMGQWLDWGRRAHIQAVRGGASGSVVDLAAAPESDDLLFHNLRGAPLTPRDVRRILDHRAAPPPPP
ncbi:MAG: tyrosine-type recombinase/integrase, partial [Microthrixaceae bacterium]